MLEFDLGSHRSTSFKEAETYELSEALEYTAGKIRKYYFLILPAG